MSDKEILGYYKRLAAGGMVDFVAAHEVPMGPHGQVVASHCFCVGKDPGQDRAITDRRTGNWADKDVVCPRMVFA